MSSDYNGPRDADGIIKYMRTKAGPTSKELKTVEEAEKFLSNNEHSIVGFFKNLEGSVAKDFLKVADQLAESYRFAHTSSPDLFAKYNHKDEIVIYQPPRLQVKLDPIENVLSGATISQTQMKNFIQNELHGIVGHRTNSNSKDFKTPLVVVYYGIDFVKDSKGLSLLLFTLFTEIITIMPSQAICTTGLETCILE